jgi:NAD+ synthase (glutamine-hydrolysing)
MYNVNAGVPKTLVRHLIRWIIDYKLNGPNGDMSFSFDNPELSYTLEDVLKTPISPELLPPDVDGNITQKTEDAVGPYVLNDFFIYYTVRHGFSPEKLLYIANQAFKDEYPPNVIKHWLSVFYKRFFNQQFKRNCMPDGPKVGSVSFSANGSFQMPSDIDSSLWNI